jgi:hypothetical protein
LNAPDDQAQLLPLVPWENCMFSLVNEARSYSIQPWAFKVILPLVPESVQPFQPVALFMAQTLPVPNGLRKSKTFAACACPAKTNAIPIAHTLTVEFTLCPPMASK